MTGRRRRGPGGELPPRVPRRSQRDRGERLGHPARGDEGRPDGRAGLHGARLGRRHAEGRAEPARRGPRSLRRGPARAARLGPRGQQGLPRVAADSAALPLRRDPQHVRPGVPPVGRVRPGQLLGGLRARPGRHHRRPGPRSPPGRVPRPGRREPLRRRRRDGGRPRRRLVPRGRRPPLLDRHDPADLPAQGREPLLQHRPALLRLPVHRRLEPRRQPEAAAHLLRIDGPPGRAPRQAHARPDHHRPARRPGLLLQPPGRVLEHVLAPAPPGHLDGDRPPGDPHPDRAPVLLRPERAPPLAAQHLDLRLLVPVGAARRHRRRDGARRRSRSTCPNATGPNPLPPSSVSQIGAQVTTMYYSPAALRRAALGPHSQPLHPPGRARQLVLRHQPVGRGPAAARAMGGRPRHGAARRGRPVPAGAQPAEDQLRDRQPVPPPRAQPAGQRRRRTEDRGRDHLRRHRLLQGR